MLTRPERRELKHQKHDGADQRQMKQGHPWTKRARAGHANDPITRSHDKQRNRQELCRNVAVKAGMGAAAEQ